MRNKLLLTILLTLATASNAATVYSPTNVLPLTATYNAEKFQYCSVDSSAPLPSANFPTSLNDFSIGRYTFTADNSHGGSTSSAAFSAWLKYWTTVYPALQSPLTLMASTLDPTSTSLPQAYLKETPIWWGTLSDAKTVSKLTYPFSSSLALTNNPFTGGVGKIWRSYKLSYQCGRIANKDRAGSKARGRRPAAWTQGKRDNREDQIYNPRRYFDIASSSS